MVREFLEDKLKKTEILLSTTSALQDASLDHEERNIMLNYPLLFQSEMLVPYVYKGTAYAKILTFIFPKNESNAFQALSIKERFDKADQYLWMT